MPAAQQEVLNRLLRVSGADRYQPVGQSPYGMTLHRRRIPVWAAVVAIFFFPFGLLALLAKVDENVAISLSPVQGGTQVTIAGQASTALQSALQYALAGNRPTAAGLPAPTAPPPSPTPSRAPEPSAPPAPAATRPAPAEPPPTAPGPPPAYMPPAPPTSAPPFAPPPPPPLAAPPGGLQQPPPHWEPPLPPSAPGQPPGGEPRKP